MFSPRKPRNCRFSFPAALVVLLITHVAHGGRPLTIDDSEPVEPRTLELEAGLKYSSDGRLTHFDFPFGVTTGVLPALEVGVGFGGRLEEREENTTGRETVTGFNDFVAGAKYKFLDAERGFGAHALAFTTKVPTADSGFGTGEFDYDLMWIVSVPLAEQWNFHFNAGYSWIGDRSDENFDDVLHYGIALDYQVSESWQLVAELAADTRIGNEQDSNLLCNGGVRWLLPNDWTIDAAVGAGLVGDIPDFTATIGFTKLFGFK